MRRAAWSLLVAAAIACGALATAPEAPSAAPANAVPAAPSAGRPIAAPAAGEDAEAIIAVAEDIDPSLAVSLREAHAKDPAAFRAALDAAGRRLVSLATLRGKRPALYEVRVKEMRLEASTAAHALALRSALEGGRIDEAAQVEEALRTDVESLVDQNLKARALELAEMDQIVRAMRLELEADANARMETAQAIVDALRQGREPPRLGGRSPVR